ncbi:MAG: carbon-nitrogen hydrolase [Gammaproteobacteria bacterium]|nr:carbon-nitrogen hydrolase [Gammaproteobacteria bacterium]
MTKLRVGLVQHACTEDRETNLAASMAGARDAAARGAEIVLLPELHTGVYFCQTEDTRRFEQAEPIPGASTETLGQLAKELNITLIGSLFERRAPGLYHNTAVVLDRRGQLAGRYRKMHIPDDPSYYEKFYFTPGDLGFAPIAADKNKLGVLVCWDQWYPEAARLMAMHGAELLFYPTAIGWDPRDTEAERARQRDAWRTVQRAHAIANGLPVIVCNRVGPEPDPSGGPGIQFWGSSFIAGPQGEILAEAPTDQPAVLVVDIDRKRTEDVRRIWPFFRDRRIDAYDDLTKRYAD